MNSLQDALYNWLTIKIVCDARPDDSAAKETRDFFEEMLTNEHHVSSIETTKDDVMYYISYQQGEETKKQRYPRELIEIMLDQINKEPEKYQEYPIVE
ncbi:hypothetical protein J1P26_23020 [Neobacillus sp. MM2021_6]|uniref:hypothetical protein n=1 Tax=Bacillaceae TaxID=186817 RepID=UPI00140D7A84|nr:MULTISPECIES: hypothetical protein [Bacillaceae]MBO0962572.1 hypothetical protein [Neobacillus sp. MM2021_6]NHC16823.1 hypothetical protein [Bacillus sp. MM2020_4]WML38954.1 hypothetical protein RCG19_17405 [Neobacillus sp. OS1-2]